MPASYFDVDGTLVRTNLVQPTVFYLLNQQTPAQSLGRLLRAAVKSPQMVLAEMRDRRTFNELLYSAYEGISRDRLLLLSEECFDKVIKPALFPNARSLVKRCRDEGQDVVLVSGALDFVLEHLVDYLGASALIANRLEFKANYATGRLLRPVVAGPEKARLIREHAKGAGYDLSHCFAYSDSYSDVPMLSVVGHPAAVNPDGKLKRLAHAYGWPVLSLD
ncbi:MAG TPA: HAD-IB family hydrolase [Polyangiaceae bacterium]|nr:HAD-IB family hydrolase [Polyangiaceae bacterium]